MINKIFNLKFLTFKRRRGSVRLSFAKQKLGGFTILETIVAIAVVSLAISGASTAVRTGLIGSSIAKDQVKAFYLAQEAIEMLRNRRDHNILNGYNGGSNTWLTGITNQDPNPARGGCAIGLTCIVDTPNNFITSCSGSWGSCPYLLQNGSVEPMAYLYGYNAGWAPTPFKREIQIESVSANEIIVTVQVSWTHGSTTRSFKTKTIIMNWF